MGIDQDQLIKIRQKPLQTLKMLRLVASVAAAACVINAGCWPEIDSNGFVTKYGHFNCGDSWQCDIMEAFYSPEPQNFGEEILINVKNDLDYAIELFWIDWDGVPHKKALIQPGDVHTRDSYVGNTFLVLAQGFACSEDYIDVHGIHGGFKVQPRQHDFTAWIDNDPIYQFKSCV